VRCGGCCKRSGRYVAELAIIGMNPVRDADARTGADPRESSTQNSALDGSSNACSESSPVTAASTGVGKSTTLLSQTIHGLLALVLDSNVRTATREASYDAYLEG
jgi:hypothetical protein